MQITDLECQECDSGQMTISTNDEFDEYDEIVVTCCDCEWACHATQDQVRQGTW